MQCLAALRMVCQFILTSRMHKSRTIFLFYVSKSKNKLTVFCQVMLKKKESALCDSLFLNMRLINKNNKDVLPNIDHSVGTHSLAIR